MATPYNPPAPAEDNWTIYLGIDMPERPYQLIGVNDEPIDYTGYTLQAQARQTPDSTAFFSLEPEWVDAATGQFKFPAMAATDTNDLTQGQYGYDVVLISGSGVREQPPLIGQIEVVQINSHLP